MLENQFTHTSEINSILVNENQTSKSKQKMYENKNDRAHFYYLFSLHIALEFIELIITELTTQPNRSQYARKLAVTGFERKSEFVDAVNR